MLFIPGVLESDIVPLGKRGRYWRLPAGHQLSLV